MCKTRSKVTHIKQQKIFHHLKRQSSYYRPIYGPIGDENILLFYVCHFAMDLTHCYETTVFIARQHTDARYS